MTKRRVKEALKVTVVVTMFGFAILSFFHLINFILYGEEVDNDYSYDKNIDKSEDDTDYDDFEDYDYEIAEEFDTK